MPGRLRKARKASGLTRAGLSHRVGHDSKIAADIEAGQRLPTVGTTARLAAALGVSATWLAYGIGEEQHEGRAADCLEMGARLQAVRTEQGQSKASLARLAALNPGSIAGIENGGQAGVDTIERLAKALGVSPAWLAYGLGERALPPRRRSRSAVAPAISRSHTSAPSFDRRRDAAT